MPMQSYDVGIGKLTASVNEGAKHTNTDSDLGIANAGANDDVEEQMTSMIRTHGLVGNQCIQPDHLCIGCTV